MELAFNELSQTPLLDDEYKAHERMLLFSKMVAEARRRGFRNIRSHFAINEIKLTNEYSLYNWMFDKQIPAVYRELFYDMFVQPFIKEGIDEIEEKYISADYYFEDSKNNIPKQKCLGLASAYLSETLSISFQSSPAWLKNTLIITIEKNDEVTSENVINVFSKECFIQDSISSFIDNIATLNIIETTLNPNDKEIHFTSHHGQKELNELWNRIKNSPYVVSGMSIGWGGNSFYKNPKKDGKLDVIHLKSDERYALQIQTTGRNLKETVEIARRLTEKYG